MTNKSGPMDGVFAALSDPTRRAVLERLRDGPASVGELARHHAMALPSFLGHLKKLEEAGLIVTAKSGRVRTCFMVPGALNGASLWVRKQNDVPPGRPDRLTSYLSRSRPAG